MRCGNTNSEIHKDVIIIGNGPSGIALSNMLSGNIPYVTSDMHPDEMLSARLSTCLGESLVSQDLVYLADGLEGRSRNPISLLLDALIHPCADIGLELESLVEWRRDGIEIDHMVFGKGPPGGSWHSMDPHILTLSLGTWMALPGMKYTTRDGAEKRAFAHNVAKYYEDYVKEMNLTKYFANGTIVTNIKELYKEEPVTMEVDQTPDTSDNKWVEKINNDLTLKINFCTRPEKEEKLESTVKQGTCPIASALSFIISRAQRRTKTDRCCKRKHDTMKSNDRKALIDMVLETKETCNKKTNLDCDNKRSVSFSYDFDNFKDTSDFLHRNTLSKQIGCSNLLGSSCRLDSGQLYKVPKISSNTSLQDSHPKWLVEVYDIKTKRVINYTCNYLVLANGSSDLPNRLSISTNKQDPNWLLHDVRSLEIELDLYVQTTQYTENIDPVLVVGAGLSAADAIIVTRGKNVPVIHVFRNKTADLGKQLPENMYPEYHKVHQMMKDGGSTYPLYTALPEYTLTDYCDSTRTVILTSKDGKEVKLSVSFAVVLIGSRPDLSFLPEYFNIGMQKNTNVDSKTNPVAINKINHSVCGYDKLYAIGPLAGDNFVRFLPGGALAIVSDLYKRCIGNNQ